jgi:cytidyltransferase-like protein
MKTVVISGGFDPIHVGHTRMINEAKKLGDKLIVILNNDNWLINKKGFVFMNENDRKEILLNLKDVDSVILTSHKLKDNDMSICKELEFIKPDISANGGDRYANNIPEYDLCKKLGIEMIFGVGGDKIRSSSDLVKQVKK